ncbi:MAG: hypothetical protein IKQ77_11280 [Prevotella sp.]|nr:hypothetical protein [Prevotella sp.]
MESRKPITLTPTTASYYWLLGVFVLWTLAGLFPFELTFEGDSLRIIAGCSVMYNQGWAVPPEVSYQYGMQPAIIYLIVSVKHLLPFLSCNTIYSLLSAIAALAAIPLAVAFVHRVTGMSKTLILFALILLPETYALSTYPNSSSFSYAFALWAFLLIMREAPFWQPLAIMCIATVFRIDIIIIYPVIFLLFLHRGTSLKKSIVLSVVAAFVVVVFMLAAYTLLQANPFKTLQAAKTMNDNGKLLQMGLIAIFSYYTIVNFILVPIGIVCVARKKQFIMLLIALLPMVLIHYFYRLNGGAAKHYLYLLPFIAILTCHAIHYLTALGKRHKVLGYAMVVALVAYYVISLRFDFPDKPWRNTEDCVSKLGPNLSLYKDASSPRHWQLGIGTSLGFFTEDELMVYSGHLFYPFYIHKVKSRQKDHIHEVKAYLDKNAPKQYAVVALTWNDLSLYPSVLLEEGYKYKKLSNRSFEMSDGNHDVVLLASEMENDESDINKVLSNIRGNIQMDGVPVYVITQMESFHHPLDRLCKKQRCRKLMQGVYEVTP